MVPVKIVAKLAGIAVISTEISTILIRIVTILVEIGTTLGRIEAVLVEIGTIQVGVGLVSPGKAAA